MDDPWFPVHVLGIAAGVVGWIAAALVYGARPGAWMNRSLAFLLAVEGSSSLLLGGLNALWALGLYADWMGPPLQAVINFCLVLLPGAYVAFVASAPSPASAFLRGPAGRVVLFAALPGATVAWFVMNGGSFTARGTWWMLMAWLVLGGLFGLAVAIAALLRARTPEGRTRARAYALAFGAHDVIWAVGALLTSGVPVPEPVYLTFALGTPAFGTLVLVPLLAYGVLRYQVLDLDLRIKIGLRRGIVAAAFLFVFLVVGQVSQAWLTDSFGVLAGGVAAAGLLFVLAPIQKVAERVADRTLPDVAPTTEYFAFRRLQVYRAAVEGVVEGGGIPSKGRSLLDRLRVELGIAPADAAAIENDLLAAGAPA